MDNLVDSFRYSFDYVYEKDNFTYQAVKLKVLRINKN